MKFEDVIEGIKGHRFSAEVNIAGGYRGFRRILAGHNLVVALVSLLKDRAVAERCLMEIGRVASLTIDLRFENPFDAALAAFLYALSVTHSDLARIGASVAQGCSRCWWARQIANDLLEGGQEASANTKVTAQSIPTLPWTVLGVATVVYQARAARPADRPIEEQVIAAPPSLADITHLYMFQTSKSKTKAQNEVYQPTNDGWRKFQGDLAHSMASTQEEEFAGV